MQPSPDAQVERYVGGGRCDDHFYLAWPGNGFLARAEHGHTALRQALIADVGKRTRRAVAPEAPAGLDVTGFARGKIAPMVRGLFPRAEQATVLDVLGRSVVFLTPANIEAVLRETRWHKTAWDLANLYLASVGAKLLSEDATQILGLSEETTCYVSLAYFRNGSRFEDFVVHEAAHVFHNCKRRTIGLPATRRREWLLEIDFARRETFAYACEAYSRIFELGERPHARRALLSELERGPMPREDRVDAQEYLDIVREAVAARNGWKRILARCSPPRTRDGGAATS